MVAHSTGVDDPCLWYRINTTPIAVHLQHRRMLLISSRGPGAGRLCWLKRGSAVPRGAVIRLNYAVASLWICPRFVTYSLLSSLRLGPVLTIFHNAVMKQNCVFVFSMFSVVGLFFTFKILSSDKTKFFNFSILFLGLYSHSHWRFIKLLQLWL